MEGIRIPTLPCLTILERRPYIFVHLAQGTHMRANLNLDQFQSLPVELRLGQGRIYLENERMVLLHIQALDALRGELIQTLGTHRARGLLMRMGFEGGKHDAEMARRLVPEASDKDLLLIGPALHALEGVAHIKPTSLKVDIARGLFEMEAVLDEAWICFRLCQHARAPNYPLSRSGMHGLWASALSRHRQDSGNVGR
jgi:hypothetical protein